VDGFTGIPEEPQPLRSNVVAVPIFIGLATTVIGILAIREKLVIAVMLVRETRSNNKLDMTVSEDV
jgi:hypothetical protein